MFEQNPGTGGVIGITSVVMRGSNRILATVPLDDAINLDREIRRAVFNVLTRMICLNRAQVQVELDNISAVMRDNDKMSAIALSERK